MDKHKADCQNRAQHCKKKYSPPRLIEWGDLRDFTQGAVAGFEDFPALGGTSGV